MYSEFSDFINFLALLWHYFPKISLPILDKLLYNDFGNEIFMSFQYTYQVFIIPIKTKE